jgi:hypothetical protein
MHPSTLRTRIALRRVRALIKSRPLDSVLPATHDHRQLAVLAIMAAAGGLAARTDIRLVVLWSCWVFANRAGGTPGRAAFSISSMGGWLNILLGDARQAARMSDFALELVRRASEPLLQARTEQNVHITVRPWLMRRRHAVEPLQHVSEQFREVGDIENYYYARFLYAIFTALGGDAVPAAEARLRDLSETVQRAGHRYPEPAQCLRVYGRLVDGDPRALERALQESDQWLASNRASADTYVRTLWMMVLCVHGRHDLVFAQSEVMKHRLFRIVPYVHVADHMFYRGVAAAALAGSARGWARWRYRRELARAHAQLKRWAKNGPDFQHMVDLLGAERASLSGNLQAARSLNEKAARRARGQGYVHHAALAEERRARMLIARKRWTDAAAALADASRTYRAWGALPKAEALAQEHRTHAG